MILCGFVQAKSSSFEFRSSSSDCSSSSLLWSSLLLFAMLSDFLETADSPLLVRRRNTHKAKHCEETGTA